MSIHVCFDVLKVPCKLKNVSENILTRLRLGPSSAVESICEILSYSTGVKFALFYPFNFER